MVRENYGRIEDWLRDAVTRAQSGGEIPESKDARDLARFLSYSLQSMFTIARTNPSEEFMTGVAETAFSVLE